MLKRIKYFLDFFLKTAHKKNAQRQVRNAFRACRCHNLQQAKKIIQELQMHDAEESSIDLLQGIVALQSQNPQAAIKYLSRVAEAPAREFFLGLAMEKIGVLQQAKTQYQKVLALRPKFIPAINNLAHLLVFSDLGAAFKLCRDGLEMASHSSDLLATMALLKLHSGEPDKAVEFFRKSLKYQPENSENRSGMIFAMNYLEEDIKNILRESAIWEKHVLKNSKPQSVYKLLNLLNLELPVFNRKLRIGYVSADFRKHSVACFFAPLIENHDKSNFEVYCYSDVDFPDEITARIKQSASCWRNIFGADCDAIRNLIRGDRIDILIDLSGHTNGKLLEIFALRTAPIQMSWLGYPGSAGLSNIDFRIGDKLTDQENADKLFSEKIIRLEHGFWTYRPPTESPPIAQLPCLKNNIFTFGSFNHQAKITEKVIEAWSSILQHDYSARLLIKNSSLSNECVREYVWKKFDQYGISAGRIILFPFSANMYEHLATYNEVDVALDTFPYNGTTTTFEALWMGVPVLTVTGNRHASRVGYAIMERIGLSEYIAGSMESYLRIASELPEKIKELGELRRTLRNRLQESPYCQIRERTRDFEAACRQAYSSRP
ncbi:MAG: hypothetical protein WC071_02830 [Victivallaceae bacterium]